MNRLPASDKIKLLRSALIGLMVKAPSLAILESLQADDKTPRSNPISVTDQVLIDAWRTLLKTK